MTRQLKRSLNDACRRIISKIIPDVSGTNLNYNHGLRVMAAQIREVVTYNKDNITTEYFIAIAAHKFLEQDPESAEEFAFNAGVCDALDDIRGYLG